MQTAMPGPAEIWEQQELLYRIEVLETCQMFQKTAPNSADVKLLVTHYQMADAYIQNLTQERRYGSSVSVSEETSKQRDTALLNLQRVIQDYRKCFSSFAPGNDTDCYRKTIAAVIQVILPVWIQYRQTYVEIKKEAL